MDEHQCCSLFGKGCTDTSFTLKASLLTLQEHQKEGYDVLFVLFVDLVKAYDVVNSELLLWKRLKLFGIPDSLIIMILKKLQTNVTYVMKVGEEEVKIEGKVGVNQGDTNIICYSHPSCTVSTTVDTKMKFCKTRF